LRTWSSAQMRIRLVGGCHFDQAVEQSDIVNRKANVIPRRRRLVTIRRSERKKLALRSGFDGRSRK
jgi:hypothetical protein